ncbi:MAG: hypothetical protein KatS3mg022_2464 [Armatimonadota bacterium]|nr:MAG: hypothetical protein KatS3mg022_2464 [Armatimonadota bacterium]
MEGKTPYEKLLELGYTVPEEFMLFPVVLLDAVSASWRLETGNDLLAYYTLLRSGEYRLPEGKGKMGILCLQESPLDPLKLIIRIITPFGTRSWKGWSA